MLDASDDTKLALTTTTPAPDPEKTGRERDTARGARTVRRSPRQRGNKRKRTVPIKRLTKEFLRVEWLKIDTAANVPILDEDGEEIERPRTRSECGSQRPCPWVGCSHHLYLDINPETGSITLNFPDREPWEIPQTCSLDVAERGGVTLEEIGDILNITRERVRQIEVRALVNKVKPLAIEKGLDEHEIGTHLMTPLAELAEGVEHEASPSAVTFSIG